MANSEKVSMFVSSNKITMKNTLLTQVKNKQKKRNIITDADLKLKMSEFILKIYDVCTPNKYGNVFPEKIIHDVGPRLKKMSPKLDRGDLHINYKKFFEVKISYKNIGEKYSITNIRDWQDLNYFILCFVDENFKPKYYCIENPQSGLLKCQEFMWFRPFTDIDYCKYGMPYRKRTRIWNNISHWQPQSLCNKDCGSMEGNRHISVAQRVGILKADGSREKLKQSELYVIPSGLVKEILEAVEISYSY